MTALPGRPLRVALVGTRGVPARYGGFETAIDEVGARLAEAGMDVTVYCRSVPGELGAPSHRGMRLVWLPSLRSRATETLSHTGLSVAHLLRQRPDAVLVFNAANAPWLPVVRAARVPVATHVDGLEWRRAKWAGMGRRYYRWAEGAAVRWSDALIADAVGIQDYYRATFGVPTRLLTYGAPLTQGPDCERLAEVGLRPQGYHLVVARLEPENHVHLVVEGYVRSRARLPLVVVGSAPYAGAYIRSVRALAHGDPRVRFLGSVWDQELLDSLYAGAATYLHGHSVGGTNPSLLRAIGAGAPTLAYDVSFNREVLASAGRYFRHPEDVAQLLEAAETDPGGTAAAGVEGRRRASAYDWDEVARGYADLIQDLVHRRIGRTRGHRRREDALVGASGVGENAQERRA